MNKSRATETINRTGVHEGGAPPGNYVTRVTRGDDTETYTIRFSRP